LRYLQQVLELQRQLGAREGEARAQHHLALAGSKNGEHERASVHALEALRLMRELDLTNLEPDVMRAVGDISSSMGRHEVALELADSVLAIWRRRGVVEDERFAQRSRGTARVGPGRHEEGVACLRLAIEMFFSRGELYEGADVLAQLGEVFLGLGDVAAARDCWLRAARVLTKLSHPDADDVRVQLGALVGGQACPLRVRPRPDPQ
jgi:tetratricopeptide (TPR) repeat protein